MGFLSEEKLKEMNFKHIGKNVKVSDKATIYNCDKISIGDNSRIDDFCAISGKIEIGQNVHIAAQCLLNGGIEGIVMEDFSGLAYGVKLIVSSDDYVDGYMTNPTVPLEYKKVYEKAIVIKKHVIIGANAVVLPGVTLGFGSSVGTTSLVTKDTEDLGVYVGVPAKQVRKRGDKLIELEKEFREKYKC